MTVAITGMIISSYTTLRGVFYSTTVGIFLCILTSALSDHGMNAMQLNCNGH